MLHTFSPNTTEAEKSKSLNLKPDWFTEQVPGQPRLGSEGNNHKHKAGENVFEQGNRHVPAPASTRTWQFGYMLLALELRSY